MKPIKVLFDRTGNTLNVWFDDPQKEHVSEETSDEVILVKDKDGKLIGFEVLNYLSADEAKDVTILHVESGVVN
ncbi:MAG: DUF2283 domain-containing protein [Acidobacteria bacterium RIFCSPLOWO2_02_FULL_67_21]|nr:MAG: DUF2283 domain-containing protein [Acidobacteria bacterium RIFCSPLOWO2_02_FULL_67_21]